MKTILTLFSILVFIGSLACKSDSGTDNTPDLDSIDITDTIFTKTSGNCTDYIEEYFSNVQDIQREVNFEGDVKIVESSTGCNITVNGIPNHNFNDESALFFEDVREITRSFSIPASPEIAGEPTPVTQGVFHAIMLNGVVVSILSAGCYDPNAGNANEDGNVLAGCSDDVDWLMDPLGAETKFGADSHNAHPSPDGTYHYHGSPNAMFDDEPGENGSPVIGFAADGFPIFGSYFLDPETNTVRKVISGYELKEGSRPGPDDNDPGGEYDGMYNNDYEFTGNGDLDECNGMTVNGQYGYYITDSYPWIIKCFSGTIDESFRREPGKVRAQDHSHWH